MQDKPVILHSHSRAAFRVGAARQSIGRDGALPSPCNLSVSSAALWRRRRPALDKCIVIDRLALRFLICELRLRGDIAVLLGLVEPELRALLLVELRPAFTLHVRALQSLHDGVL